MKNCALSLIKLEKLYVQSKIIIINTADDYLFLSITILYLKVIYH